LQDLRFANWHGRRNQAAGRNPPKPPFEAHLASLRSTAKGLELEPRSEAKMEAAVAGRSRRSILPDGSAKPPPADETSRRALQRPLRAHR
jgi:hypothetical protein